MSKIERKAIVPQRILRPPRSVSDEARTALSNLVAEDGYPINARYEMPEPDDVEGWMKMKALAEMHYAASIEDVVRGLRAQVQTISVDRATIHLATPLSPFDEAGALIDLHGGALVFGGGEACAVSARRQADRHDLRTYGVDYRMPPEHAFPAALEDCVAAYRYILKSHKARRIIICGRSAGGNLAAAMLLRARDEGLPMPGGLVLLSPQVDLTESGDSFQTNSMVDLVLPGSLMANNLLYAKGKDLADPDLSPLFGNLDGFPPTLLQSGTRDLFLSNTVRMHRALRTAGVDATLHVFEAMPHGGFTGATAEDFEIEREVRAFVRAILQ